MKEDKYFDIEKRTEIRETARKLRRQFLRYQEAELVYSMTHRKLLEIAGKAGAIYRIDNTVLINRDIFNEYTVLPLSCSLIRENARARKSDNKI